MSTLSLTHPVYYSVPCSIEACKLGEALYSCLDGKI